MVDPKSLTFAVATNDRGMLEKHLLASPCLRPPHTHQILLQEGFRSAATAYNDAIDRSENEVIVFIHQDVFLPEAWPSELHQALEWVDREDPNWGVLGCYGVTHEDRCRGLVYTTGWGVVGKPSDHPEEVQTLDEIVLVLRRSSGLRFDDAMPHFHLYGADICLAAAKRRMKNYAISAFCIHNTQQIRVLPREFYECYWHLKRKWREFLPIQTSCMPVTRTDLPMRKKQLREFYLRYIRRAGLAVPRESDLVRLLEKARAAQENSKDVIAMPSQGEEPRHAESPLGADPYGT